MTTGNGIDEPNYDAVRHALARLRMDRGMTLDQLSGAADVPRSVLTDLEAGRSRGSIQTWYRLATVLEVTVGVLLDHLHDKQITTLQPY